MAHLTARQSYTDLTERLNRFPQGAPPSELLYRILGMLFSDREAELVAKLPLRPFSAEQAARNWKVGVAEAETILQKLAGRALLVDMKVGGRMEYVLPPPMAGFFEFALMRVRNDIDQKLLSELYEQYITVEEDFIKALFVDGKTQLGRVFVQEEVLTREQSLHVLDFERATAVIESASEIGIGICYCRHKKQHQGTACNAEMDICMTFNVVAESLNRHGVTRRIDKGECLELLHKAVAQNLVQFGENIQNGVNFICNCCPCCCEAMITAQRFGMMNPVHTSNFIPEIDESCSGCGQCIPVCPVKVISLETEGDNGFGRKKAVIEKELCLGCGVCVRNCPRQSLSMQWREQRVITPVNSTHKTVLMAIERGKLQNLVYDNQVLWSHRTLAALLGVILKLPPVKQLLASEQVGSSYIGALCEKYEKERQLTGGFL